MSLIHANNEIIRSIQRVSEQAKKQQMIYSTLIKEMVRLHQKYRLAKNYAVSDEIRDSLNSVGVKIIQGTDGYKYEEIPKALKGRQVQDTWVFD